MMSADDKQEIIIVRRIVDGEDGHHGGAWKIAFADFMTAMMALFLVLWLINAANEETKKSVASYFNPVKLVDRNRSTRGLNDSAGLETKGDKKAGDRDEEFQVPENDGPSDAVKNSEALLLNPEQTLDKIAEKRDPIDLNDIQSARQINQLSSMDDAYLDPFSAPIETSNRASQEPEKSVAKTASVDAEIEKSLLSAAEVRAAQMSDKDEPKPNSDSKLMEQKAPERAVSAVNFKLAKEIEDDIRSELGERLDLFKGVTVKQTRDGVLISVTDQLGFSMFEVGSAVPVARLINVMDAISAALVPQQGFIRVYGHTDGRPYVAGEYDNWRLSTARAHSARLMLSRKGVNSERIAQISGYGDSRLADKIDPTSSSNRRVEILLEPAS